MIKKVLTIAGSDSGGCAGIQADIKSISACGGFATSVITAITSQNTLGVTYIEELSLKSIETQLDAVLSDIGTDAVKTGMVASTDIIKLIAEKITQYKITNYVFDPVMVATSGDTLLKSDAIDSLKKYLLPLSMLITPNIPEAEILSNIKINSDETIKEAAKIIHSQGAKNVLIKGGHTEDKDSTDILYDGVNFKEFKDLRINTKNTHGTGCTYSAAIATYLARTDKLLDAIALAKTYITESLAFGMSMNIGSGSGPVNHFYRLNTALSDKYDN